MRFLVQNIADWILDQLLEIKQMSDDELHWKACNQFLTRDEIITNAPSLRKFSKEYEKAVAGLVNENYVFHNEEDSLIVYAEVEKKHIKPLKAQVKTENKISCLYIVEFENGCKVGMTKNMKARIAEYLKPWSRPVLSASIVECENPLEIEGHLKRVFRKKRLGRSTEFFSIEKEVIENEVMALAPFSVFHSYESDRIAQNLLSL